jgi:hypothetical protein
LADDAQQPSADAQLRSDVSRGTAPVLEGPAPEDLDARAPHVSRGTAGAMRRPSARRSKRPEPADQGFRRTVQQDTAALCQRGPPQVGTLATHRGVSRGTAKHRIRGLGSVPAFHSGRPQVGISSPIGTARRYTSTARSAVGVGEPAAAAAAGRRRAGGFAGDRGAQWVNVTDDCCWSSARDPQAYRAASGARSGHLFAWIGWRGHVGCFTSDCR